MARYPSSSSSYSFGPGAMTPTVKWLVITNVIVFLVNMIVPIMTIQLGLQPRAVFEGRALWQPVTYMFLHDTGGVGHILFNMLALWMFGTELERTWGSRFFTKYYFVTGIGAAVATLLLSIWVESIYDSVTVGASGAIYGLLLAYGMYFPNRTVYLYIFPIPAKYFVMIAGAISLVSGLGGPGSGVAHIAHLGGLIVGYFYLLYLKNVRTRPLDELKYRWLKWRMGRARSRFDVYTGGKSDDDSWKSDWKKHIH